MNSKKVVKIPTLQIIPVIGFIIGLVFFMVGMGDFGFWNHDTNTPTEGFFPIIIAAGFGSRLVPITLERPKPLVVVNGIRKEIYGKLRSDIGKILRTLCEYKEVEIIEAHAMKDHIHMLVMIPPKLAVSSFMGYLKGKSSLMIFERHANLKYKYGNRNFWAKGYFVSTVGLKDEVAREYIKNQELEDMKEDNLSKKEYVDPFKKAQK